MISMLPIVNILIPSKSVVRLPRTSLNFPRIGAQTAEEMERERAVHVVLLYARFISFTSFVLGLYNAAGPGQPIDAQDKADIARIAKPMEMQVLVTLSCTMCPELVTAVQRIAAENPHVTAEVYDVNHFPKLREQYRVMSVPCLVVNGEAVSFGKKNLRQVLDFILQ